MNLNEEQLKVVNAGNGIWKVEAGAGAGKSSVLVERTIRLINEGVNPSNILLLSFTAEAAKNLRTRMEDRVEVPAISQTFHSFSLGFATKEHDQFPFPLADNPLATEGVAAKIGYELANKYKTNYRALRSYISLQKRNRIDPKSAIAYAEKMNKDQSLALAYKQYNAKLREAGLLDFDSLIEETVNLMEKRADIRARHQFEYLMVDECQDLSRDQYDLVKLLIEQHGNALFTGDGNQAIYAWRGGHNELFLSLQDNFPNVKRLFMGVNYRSTKKIVEYVKSVAPIKNELLEHFRTDNEEGIEPEIRMYSTSGREAEEVVKQIKQVEGETTAILCRTNQGLRCVEEQLIEQSVKYHMLGDSGFWTAPEVKNVVSYLQCCQGITDAAVLGAIRSPFSASRYLKKKQIVDDIKDRQHGLDPKPSAWSILTGNPNLAVVEFCKFIRSLSAYRHLPAKDAVKNVLERLRALEHYQEEEFVESDNNPVENLKELYKASVKHSSLGDFLNFIRRVQAASKRKKGTAVSTIHRFKGREASQVWLVQCCEGVLPHKRSNDLAEEANLYYVACSRPQKRLHISYVGQPSRFLNLQPKEE
jgi:superfamily I DNA/RNA helicase